MKHVYEGAEGKAIIRIASDGKPTWRITGRLTATELAEAQQIMLSLAVPETVREPVYETEGSVVRVRTSK